MESFLVLFFLLLIATVTSPSAAPETSPLTIPSPPPQSQPLHLRRGGPRPSQPPPPPSPAAPPPATETPDEQLNHIVDALIGAGDFGNWASVISGAVLPLSATLFVPENEAAPAATVAAAASAGGSDPFMLPYHVVPQRLTFEELLAIRTGTRLPTLLPGKTVVVTDNSPLGFAIDGSRVTAPDLYSTTTFTVHGVARVFDYSIYGDELIEVPNAGPTPPAASDRSQPSETPADRGLPGIISGAAPPCLCAELPVKLLAVCVILGFKIHWNSFRSKAY